MFSQKGRGPFLPVKEVRPLGIFEVLMVLTSFGTLLICLVTLIVELINKK
ncbi:putative holin-like toxin [Lentibacillus juripiscarius]|uniref:Holin-like toxin n=1 Tax=Lentibacillus juripiscarius TaxID=257446 RepID=A0ABW5V984_9BACI